MDNRPGRARDRNRPRPVFHFDFTDPGSWVFSLMIDRAGAEDRVDWRGFEARPPPAPLADPRGPGWLRRRERAMALAASVLGKRAPAIALPPLLPWTRKAHELCEFARERGLLHPVRRALFEACLVDCADIGRIDLLVGIAADAGLDRTEAKASLDVDRYAEAVLRGRGTALARGVAGVPALAAATGHLADFGALGEIGRRIAAWNADDPQE